MGLTLCFLPFFFGGGGRSIIRFGGFANISSARRTPSVHASRPCPCACSPSARANNISHASSDGFRFENTCCCCC
uniref:Putative secreted protein n=1 Tax=Anopheles darlingi TaxID=43151 RepID=A0A2M4D105_ANODA